jgi:lysophospholipase L1-like esterase
MKASQLVSMRLRQIGAAFFIGLATASAQTAAPTPTAAPTANVPATVAASLPAIVVCGDSTAKNNGRGAQGWGTAIAAYFDPAKATVNNVAHAGTSSRTYYNGDWPKVLPQIKAGDYVLIVFGINDGGLHTPPGLGDEVDAQGWHTYGWYMSKMATDAQAKGAHVYLLTVTERNIWTNPKAVFKDATITTQQDGYTTADDRADRANWGKYPEWTKEVGAKLHLPVLDLTTLESDTYDKMGREKVMVNYLDHNHTNPAGADIVASIIVSGLKAFKNSPFTPLLSDKGKAVATADAKYVSANEMTATDQARAAKPADASAPATPAAK